MKKAQVFFLEKEEDLSQIVDFVLPILKWPTRIFLEGDLGAGKTTFVRYLLRALGVKDRVKSPTFSVMESYPLSDSREIFHYDLYRFSRGAFEEIELLGLREQWAGPNLILIEWADRLMNRLTPDLIIEIKMIENEGREIWIKKLD